MSWQAAKQDMAFELERQAWKLYCKDTAGCMDVKDFWHELSLEVQEMYKKRVEMLRNK